MMFQHVFAAHFEEDALFLVDGTDTAEEGTWVSHLTHSTLTYLNWLPPDPNGLALENCMALYRRGTGFLDVPCTATGDRQYFAVCEHTGKCMYIPITLKLHTVYQICSERAYSQLYLI